VSDRTRKLDIAETLRNRIYAGEIAPGERLPSIRDTAQREGAAINTVKEAYYLLRDWGLIESDVTGSRRRSNGAISGPAERLSRMAAGLSPLSPGETSEITSAGLIEPQNVPEHIARALSLSPDSAVARRAGIVFDQGGEPVELTLVWHPEDVACRAPTVMVAVPIERGTVSALREAGYEVEGTGAHIVRAGQADAYAAGELGLSVGASVLVVCSSRRASSGRVVEYLEQYYPGERGLHWQGR
jgi:GntR family transcriptional regulator